MKDEYPTGKADLMTAFMVRAQDLTTRGGSWAIIDLPSWMSLKSFEDLRRDLLQTQRIASLVHLGRGVFGSDFGSVAFVIDNVAPKPIATGVYRRLFEQHVDVRSVATIERLFLDREYNSFEVKQADFAVIPGSPIVYWLSEKMRATFSVGRPLGEISTPLVGLRTGDNSRFMRQWWEVSKERSALGCDSLNAAEASGARWFPYNKGGAFRRWYGNHEFVVNWEHDGKEVEEALAIRYPYLVPAGKALVRGQGRNQYFSPAVSWSAITSGNPSFRYYPQGFIPSNAGMACYAQETTLMSVVSIANSAVAEQLLSAIAPTLNLGAGETAKVPMPSRADDGIQARVVALIENSSADWNSAETSWGFVENPLINT